MIRSGSGCAHRRHQGFTAPAGLGGYPDYYRLYKFPGYSREQ
jgi:hypothetical protein